MQPKLVVHRIVEQLDSLHADHTPSAASRLARIQEYDGLALSLLAEDERQFFASDYARRLFLFDKYQVPSALRQEFFLIRARSKAAHYEQDAETLTLICERYTECLRNFLQSVLRKAERDEGLQHTSRDAENGSALSRNTTSLREPETIGGEGNHPPPWNESEQKPASRLSPDQQHQSYAAGSESSGQSLSAQIVETATTASTAQTPALLDLGLLRVYHLETVSTAPFQDRKRVVLRCRTEGNSEILLSIWDDQSLAMHELWAGAILHVTHAQQRSSSHYSTTSQSLVVLEPDVLIDVTDVAECFQSRAVEPLLFFLRRFTQSRATEAMAVGSIVNSCFDEILHDPTVTFKAMFERALQSKPLTMLATIQADTLGEVRSRVEEQVNRLRELCAQWRDCSLSTEPSFLSPLFGLQGRLDLLVEYAEDDLRKTVVELKSGSAPALQTAGAPGARALWVNHLAQISCYNLLLDSAFPGRRGDSQILYARATEFPLRNAPNDVKFKQHVLLCRNHIICFEHQLLERNFRVLNLLCSAELVVPSFMQEDCSSLQRVLRGLDKAELRYLQAFLSFMVREQYTQRMGLDSSGRGFAALWSDTVAEKIERMSILRGLEFNAEKSSLDALHLSFDLRAKEKTATVFRVGDVAILRPQNSAVAPYLEGQVIKCSVRAISESSVQLSLRNKSSDVNLFATLGPWMLESDYIESSANNVYGWFMHFFHCDKAKRQRLLGLAAPRIATRIAVRDEGLTDLQNIILNEALAAEDYYLIQGPPGTGKTSVMLRSIAKHLLQDSDETLLVIAFTNRAVDEMCKALLNVVESEQLLRMGTRYTTEYPEVLFAERAKTKTMDEQRQILESARVIVSTVSFLHANPELLQLKRCTTALVDEASQIGEAQLIGIVSELRRCIMIGDEKQLPAVVSQSETLCLIENTELASMGVKDLRVSLFERLLERCRSNNWVHSFRMLEQQARMHKSIQNIASTLYYRSRLQPLHAWQTEEAAWLVQQHSRTTATHTQDGAASSLHLSIAGKSPSVLAEHRIDEIELQSSEFTAWDLLLQSRVVFINTPKEHHSKRNLLEARLCAEIVSRLAEKSGSAFSPQTVGVISPFRAQVREIESTITDSIRHLVTIDTVERFQGSERDHILFSSSLNSVLQLRSIQSLSQVDGIEVDRKLNVVLTRARQQFILVGNETILSSSVHYQRLIDYILEHGQVFNYDQLLPSGL